MKCRLPGCYLGVLKDVNKLQSRPGADENYPRSETALRVWTNYAWRVDLNLTDQMSHDEQLRACKGHSNYFNNNLWKESNGWIKEDAVGYNRRGEHSNTFF